MAEPHECDHPGAIDPRPAQEATLTIALPAGEAEGGPRRVRFTRRTVREPHPVLTFARQWRPKGPGKGRFVVAQQRHTMTSVRWTLLALGTLALVVAEVAADDVTARFTAAMAYGYGVIILGIAEWIIARTRNHLQVRMANARQGIDK